MSTEQNKAVVRRFADAFTHALSQDGKRYKV
jgi:hypothetical protein